MFTETITCFLKCANEKFALMNQWEIRKIWRESGKVTVHHKLDKVIEESKSTNVDHVEDHCDEVCRTHGTEGLFEQITSNGQVVQKW